MVKIGPVKEQNMEFDQGLYPESEEELNKIVKICMKNKYSFAVPILKEPIELKSAISDHKFTLNHVVLIFNDHCDDILNKLEEVM
jgi:hypothetical protein